MNIREFTESVIEIYLEEGGTVHPDITLDIFLLIEKDESLLNDYIALTKHYREVNHIIGKTVRQHFDLRNDKTILVTTEQCKLLKSYMRFCNKS